jgi:hypothetical protein
VDVGHVGHKLNRLVVLTNALDGYQSRVLNGLVALEVVENRLKSVKAEEIIHLQSATCRRDDAKHRLRVEIIEHEMNMERTRHADAAVDFETKAKDMDDAKVKEPKESRKQSLHHKEVQTFLYT